MLVIWRRNGLNWFPLRNEELDRAYAKTLASLDMTDTLIAVAEKP